jgi:NAD(P)-dependent dehydrogenase (short-subunit alcohol dehydrogenase family)
MTTAQRKIGSGFGARSTATEVLCGSDLSGKLAIVTGGYSGLGRETTRAHTAAGAHVVVPARRPEAADKALAGVDGAEVDALDLTTWEACVVSGSASWRPAGASTS